MAQATTLATVVVPTLTPESSSAVEIYVNLGSTYEKTERPWTPGHLPFVEITPSESASALAERSERNNSSPSSGPATSSGKNAYDLGHELCRFRVDDAEDAQRLWEETGAGKVLGDWVKNMDANNETQ